MDFVYKGLIRYMKIDWHLFWQQRRTQLVSGVLMCGSGLFLGAAAPGWVAEHPVEIVPVVEATPSAARAVRAATVPQAEKEETAPSQTDPVLLPDSLNLCEIYEEDGPGALNLAQKLYDLLADREAEWLSQIYALYGKVPAQLASEGQLPSGTLPESLQEFKGVKLTFTNGDGAVIWDSSNIKDIMAMTSVYHYYGRLQTWEEIQNYAMALWEASHSYSYTVSPVYYCQGCIENGLLQEEEATGSDAQETVLTATLSGALKEKEDGTLILEGKDGGPGIDQETLRELEEQVLSGQEEEDRELQGEDSEENISGEAKEEIGGPLICTGHMDLSVVIRMAGLTEQNGLYTLDEAGNSGISPEDGWPGWNEETRAYVASLEEKDWMAEYGLEVEGMILRNPLTSAELDYYMNLAGPGLSEERRQIIYCALTSVGKIPYYWGGKPSARGYEGNGFGTVVSPDVDGRFFKGLDCSGWISWVYWSATGNRLAGESTSRMISCGTGITKEELQPGDICIRLGDMAHVVLFLGWTQDGQMLCIQETSGNINNVEVGITTPDWSYYRRLVQ